MKRPYTALLSLAAGVVLTKTIRERLRDRKAPVIRISQPEDGAISALDDAGLRARFAELAPEFRRTHAGAGKPRWVGDEELNRFMSMGLVECVKRPHVAAGMLEIYKLTELGDRVRAKLAHAEGKWK